MPADPPADLVLTPINGKGRSLQQWLTNFHLLVIALDPYTNEGAWILPIATRIIGTFEQADCRVALLLPADPDDCRRFLGPLARDVLTFTDPDRTAIRGFGLERLPAIIHVAMDGTVVRAAEGWNPAEWKAVTSALAEKMRWTAPLLPAPSDPGPFQGSPALT
ncbi:MAG: hypothetical protein KY454_00845 [Actinobacteria bacterium]|nr:hypothetical protein [Actinomycetota bacterium]